MEVWKQYGIGSGQFIPYRFCFEDDVEVYEVEIVENLNTVLRLKPVVMGKEKLDDNADNVDQPAAMNQMIIKKHSRMVYFHVLRHTVGLPLQSMEI